MQIQRSKNHFVQSLYFRCQQGDKYQVRKHCLSNGGKAGEGQGHGNVLAGDDASRVDLAKLPIGVLPLFFRAVKRKLGSALGVEAAAFLLARPGLVDVEGIVATAKVEASLRQAAVRLCAVVVDVTVEEGVEPARGGAALGIVVEVLVGELKVDVAPRVLVSWSSEGV